MNSYRHIPIWENSQRIKDLSKFRNDVVSFFKESTYFGVGIGRVEKAEARVVRQRINLTLVQVHRFINAAGIDPTLTWTPPPNIGGYVKHIDVIINLFELDQYQIPAKRSVDFIEMAIGVYLSNRTAAFWRTLNPFWWLNRGFLWIVRAPFVFLGAVGFDTVRAESSVVGKTIKAIVGLVTMVAALLTILRLLDWLPAAKTLLGIK